MLGFKSYQQIYYILQIINPFPLVSQRLQLKLISLKKYEITIM